MSTLTKDPSGTSYRYTPASDVEVEVGDAPQTSTFYPQVKIKRWDNECNFSFRLNLPGGGRETVSEIEGGTKVVWERGDYRALFYDRSDIGEHGALEFEIHLGKKPPSNSFSFSYMSKGVEFLYQPPLTADEIAAGHIRPANVVGSYAVYAKGKRDSQYQTGKVCHIYRPHAVDALGNEMWGTISISQPDANGNGTVTLSLPQAWLDSAFYPVVVDPTFGYSTQGASEWSAPTNYLFMMGGTGAAGTGDYIKAYCRNQGIESWIRGVLVRKSDDTIVTNGLTWTYQLSGSMSLMSAAFQSAPTITAQDYWSCAAFSNYAYLAYDSVGDGAIDTSNSYNSPTNPTDKSTSNNRFSIWTDYTASAASAARRLTLLGVN